MVGKFRRAPAGFPGAVQLPYPMVDNNTLQAGENAGFLGQAYDPIIARPERGRPYGGVSRDLGAMVFRPADGVDAPRLAARRDVTGAQKASDTAITVLERLVNDVDRMS